MSERRYDPTLAEWVVLARQRALRPDEFRGYAGEAMSNAGNACPFCPGNEAAGPECERLRLPDDGTPWAVRVIRNRYPAFVPEAGEPAPGNGPFRAAPAVGDHEVVIESPHHDGDLHTLPAAHAALVLQAYQRRFVALHGQRGVRYVMPIRNHGAGSGASLSHPHGQILATDTEPPLARRKREVARRHHRTHGRCLYCDLRDAEAADGRRIVFRTPHFVALHPYASRYPFETWLLPRRHAASFAAADDDVLADAAAALQRVLALLEAALGPHSYNCMLYSAPPARADRPQDCWHLVVVPRLIVTGGFELGTGTIVNQAFPEETAPYLAGLARRAGRRHRRDVAPEVGLT